MKTNKIIMALVGVALAGVTVNANALTATGTLTPSITIMGACVVAVTGDTDFPATPLSAASTVVSGVIGTVTVTGCTGTNYKLGAGAGSWYVSPDRHLGSAAGMVYTLDLSGVGTVTNWGDFGLTTPTTAAAQAAFSRTSATASDVYTITGNVTTLPTPIAGTFSDSVTITAEF